MNMNKQKFMELVSKAFDEGARIDILNYGIGIKKDAAEEVANKFGESVGVPVKEVTSVASDGKWFVVEEANVHVSFHYDNPDSFLVEDVDLDGMEEDAYATN